MSTIEVQRDAPPASFSRMSDVRDLLEDCIDLSVQSLDELIDQLTKVRDMERAHNYRRIEAYCTTDESGPHNLCIYGIREETDEEYAGRYKAHMWSLDRFRKEMQAKYLKLKEEFEPESDVRNSQERV